MFLNTVLTIAL